ncbi:MAG: DUF2934 domain-containing protein [Spirochaetes bacterium]|nr:DUF2934 domain-containing protein [Spirochaetota bacterium]
MIQKELNEENKERMNKAYELYEKHGFKDGNDFVDWLEAEKQTGKNSDTKLKRRSTEAGQFPLKADNDKPVTRVEIFRKVRAWRRENRMKERDTEAGSV